jgi:1-aminocyclopropane-1-carboxylate deaminase/D-cysteine desulfhydrase-like pyridoxal-dependent ACC family enzyme
MMPSTHCSSRWTLDLLRTCEEVPLCQWPTPLQRITRPGRSDLLVKRDDLCGHGRGGAKARKISHLLGHLIATGHDELLTMAGNITNLAFDLLPAVDRLGLRTRIFIVDDPPAPPVERHRIFEGVADRIELLGNHASASLAVIQAYRGSQRARRRPFLALPGISHPASVIGNARGFLEMVDQVQAAGSPLPRAVYVTAATGTTIAGFLLAAEALVRTGQPRIEVVGVQVYPGCIGLRTLALTRWTERFLGVAQRTPVGRRNFVRAKEAFASFGRTLPELCTRVDADHGLRVDPIFGGKTWNAMERDQEANAPGERPLLYWHCGYTPEWRSLCKAVGHIAEGT